MHKQKMNHESMGAEVVKGALAGAVGVWALDRITWFMWNREDPEALAREQRARPEGLDPAHVMANRTAEALGQHLSPRQPHLAGIIAHYMLGILPGALYGAMRHRTRGLGAGRGLLFGLGLFLLHDELTNWMLGTSGAPTKYPWQAHARGMAGHLAYGVATDAALELLDRES